MAAAAPFSACGRTASTLADCEVGCSSSVIGTGEALRRKSEGGRRTENLGTGSRRIRNFFGRKGRDLHSVWDDYSSEGVSNSSICKFCCHGQQNGKGKLRSQHLGFERRDGALSSKIRGGALKNPLSVVIVERQLGEGRRRKVLRRFTLYAALDAYEVLGVPTTATDKEIKQAYRKLALKLHPDVNKQPDAQQQFLRVKNAYQTLSDENSRAAYDASKRGSPSWDPFSWETERSAQKEEEFYGFGEFFKDVSVSLEDFFRDLQGDRRRQASKPKSLWEELADIGEEFVEFLEKELNINETTAKEERSSGDGARNDKKWSDARAGKKKSEGPTASQDQEAGKAQVKDEIAEIEDMLAQLKKELGI